jgi:hypothetical protein
MESLPTELMAMVVQATGANNKPILGGVDVGNFRLANRQINSNVFYAWAKRFLTTRKHMLSCTSLKCLLDIANDPVMS